MGLGVVSELNHVAYAVNPTFNGVSSPGAIWGVPTVAAAWGVAAPAGGEVLGSGSIGNITIGSSTGSGNSGGAVLVYPTANFTAKSVRWYCTAATAKSLRFALYSDTMGTPNTLMAITSAFISTNAGSVWVCQNLNTFPEVTTTTPVWVAWLNTSSAGIGYAYFGTTPRHNITGNSVWPNFPDPFTLSSTSPRYVSIYASSDLCP